MDLDEIKKILDMMREHDLAEFELEQDGVKVRLRKNSASAVERSGARCCRPRPSRQPPAVPTGRAPANRPSSVR